MSEAASTEAGTTEPETAEPETAEVRYAGFWRRVGASLVDTVIFTVVLIVLLTLLYGREYLDWYMDPGRDPFSPYSNASALLQYVVIVGATLYFWVRYLGTPGKLLLSCHVVDADTYQALRPAQAVGRYFAYILSALPLGFGFLWVAWDKRKQAFHDKLANTVVILVDESDKSLEELEREAE